MYYCCSVILNNNVNTKFDEESPYIHGDGTLYFSSKGHNSIGGYDIFSSNPASGSSFEKAENLLEDYLPGFHQQR